MWTQRRRGAGRWAGLLALVVAALAAFTAAAPVGPPMTTEQKTDREALIALRSAISPGGFGTSKLKTWKVGGNPCFPKPWPGLQCTAGRVTSLVLSNLNIAATLPSKLRQMNALKTLKLDGNRFTGTLPELWADSKYFIALQTLDLHDNMLSGTLPSTRWNRKNAFRSLQMLDLSINQFFGGLPAGWLSTNKVFRRLKTLDLSQNLLGTTDGETPCTTTACWCPPGPAALGPTAATVGWCPSGIPLANTMQSLLMLDLSDNQLRGLLPSKWPVMFPNLQFLALNDNHLFATPADPADESKGGRPARLPTRWTQSTYPIAFPALSGLTLWPGNEYICFLPHLTATFVDGFADVNPDYTYPVYDSDQNNYDTDNPWLCPGPGNDPNAIGVDSVPDDVALGLKGGKLVVSWSVTKLESSYAFGFRVTLEQEDVNDGELNINPALNGQLYRTYRGADFPALVPALTEKVDPTTGTVTYVLVTSVTPAADMANRISVSTFNIDSQDSAIAQATATWTQAQIAGS